MPKKYFIYTFGCHESEADSERIAGDYEARNYTSALTWEDADEIILNTCSVQQSSEDRVIDYIDEIKKYFTENKLPKPKIIFTGCMTHHGAQVILKQIPFVDEVLHISEVGFNTPAIRRDKNHAWVQISSGCNCFCSFCIIPYSRGREVSRPMEDIVNEVNGLSESGYSEITLLAMNTNSYGLEKDGKCIKELLLNFDKPLTNKNIPQNQRQYKSSKSTTPFIKLLRRLSQFKSIKKIDFLSASIWDFSDELIEEVVTNPKISKHFYLPIQSGSDRILKLMNRGYTNADTVKFITKIKTRVPCATFSSDFIVGFPTESESEFQETISLAKKIKFSHANIFYYSPRPGTIAYRLYPDDISLVVKKRRWNELNLLINKD
ncbi:MAG: hypothetical protein ACD_19C00338G0002 [uncultured bacterium]|nr:MAG: hypothetical protein ACD_19C00338G0002 [uncultured bacterium]